MTEKRGTGTEYGQNKLKDRTENYDNATNEKNPKSKLKLLSALIIAIIGVGALYPVVFSDHKTPAEKNEEIIALNANGISIEDNKENKVNVQPAVSDADFDDTAPPTNPSADVISAEKPVAPENLPDEDVQGSSSPNNDSEELLLDIAAPANASADTIPTEKSVDHANEAEKLLDEDVQGIANAVINDSMVKATEEAQKVSHTDIPHQEYEASKFGISGESTPVPAAVQREKSQPKQSSVEQLATIVPDTASTDLNSDDSLKNYTGQSSEAVFHVQSQNTVYVYGTFAAKVYLLPMAKGEKINAYLSDSKGWEVSQLPGNILRIKRAQNKADWSDATDLFLVAGKRTYTLILQAVDQPKLRTDSLRYVEPTT
ncbi:hypothetical protein [Xenorhabdus sp. KJ12.1]|uniref:hypothetical protein n=1 Tax=Xenorhabdus sp. KJ12.1 TaxID=1851571 RepID=UPI000C04E7B4|nr:hypothetical protein [Xenorhabdus sp. KJ12.1]PHM72410.1 hypothetical protein Xekj_00689 [Xenorhabdus sp. KJ12.1]